MKFLRGMKGKRKWNIIDFEYDYIGQYFEKNWKNLFFKKTLIYFEVQKSKEKAESIITHPSFTSSSCTSEERLILIGSYTQWKGCEWSFFLYFPPYKMISKSLSIYNFTTFLKKSKTTIFIQNREKTMILQER